ncbi:MAG TPA: hypothetical protein VN638_05645 [Nitrospiraceae bacterium]|nr:hypothetical protein [Nitrospiraceae bacterium]
MGQLLALEAGDVVRDRRPAHARAHLVLVKDLHIDGWRWWYRRYAPADAVLIP